MSEMAVYLPDALEDRINPVPPEVRLYTTWIRGRKVRRIARVAGQTLSRTSMDGALVETRKFINAQANAPVEPGPSAAEAI